MTPPESVSPPDDVPLDPSMQDRYLRLLAIGRELTTTLDIGALQARIVEAAADLVDCEVVALAMADSDGTLQIVASQGPDGVAVEPVELDQETSLAGAAIDAGQPLEVADTAGEGRWQAAGEVGHFAARAVLAIPFTEDQVIGCLEAINPPSGVFSAADRVVWAELAAQAGTALYNAHRFDQSDLISEMIHELRTPLAAVKSTMHIILRPELSEEKRQHLVATVQRETDRLARMTGDFLRLARLESGRITLHHDPIDVSLIVREAIDPIRGKAAQSGIEMSDDLTPREGWPQVVGDGSLLALAMHNLLINAVKYNVEGGAIRVRGRVTDDRVEVEITDTGRGISIENLPYVFDRFFRVPDGEGYTDGSGLGLAIARRIIEGHGGAISAESEKGIGTTLRFWLPLA